MHQTKVEKMKSLINDESEEERAKLCEYSRLNNAVPGKPGFFYAPASDRKYYSSQVISNYLMYYVVARTSIRQLLMHLTMNI